jgi:Bacterial Ig-like domain (group 3)/FG-GAP-like repeat/Chitobiase/beta-hexosaminidase C-terminal domain/NHL repeat
MCSVPRQPSSRPLFSYTFSWNHGFGRRRRVDCLTWIFLISAALFAPTALSAATATTTTLAVSPATSAPGQTVITLTATVTAGASPVALGTVDFFDTYSPGLPIRTMQLNSSGTAKFKIVLGVGSHSLTASFRARTGYAASTSSAQAFTVTPSGNLKVVNNLTDVETQGVYTLYSTLSLHGKSSPSGTVNFVSPSNSSSFGSVAPVFQSAGYDSFKIYPDAGYNDGIAMGDFNNDGYLDLAISNDNGTVAILLGNGDGTFQAPVTYDLGTEPAGLIAADINNDGNLDLVSTDEYTGDTLLVLLGNGDGTFQTQMDTTLAVGPYGFALADVNGDGKLDLVYTNVGYLGTTGNGAFAYVMLGNGDGTFQTPVGLTSSYDGVSPAGIAIADMNGDGIPDLAIVNQGYYTGSSFTSDSLSVLLGNGDGTFGNAVDYAIPNGPGAPTIADLRQDGKQDVILNGGYTSQETQVLLGNGDGTLQTAVSYQSGALGGTTVIGDFNDDGKLDIAVPVDNENVGIAYINVLPGNGDGTFGTFYSAAGSTSGINGLVAGDFNGSGLLSFAGSTEDAGAAVNLANLTYQAQVDNILVNTQETAQADYVPGVSDAYGSVDSNIVTLTPAQYSVAFTTPPPTPLAAGQSPGTVAVTVYVDGAVLTATSVNLTVTVTGPNGYYQVYTQPSVNGVATFSSLPALTTAGAYVFTAGAASLTLTQNAQVAVTVTDSATTATALAITGKFPTLANPGVATPWTISAVDQYGNTVAAFTGTVTVSSSDPAAVFTPVSHTYAAADAGSFIFQIALTTAGTQSLTASSAGLPAVSQTGITVGTSTVKTSLTISPASPQPVKTLETLTATVTNGSGPQYPGTVAFYDTSRTPHLIGTAQLTTAGVATLKIVLPVGSHPITATFNGTTTAPTNTTAQQTYVVSNQEVLATSGLLYSTQYPGYTTLEDIAGFFGSPAPTGTVNYIDGNSGSVLGTSALTGPYYDFVINTLDTRTGTTGYELAAGDVNGDGILDVVAVNSVSTDNTVTVFLGNGDGTFTQGQVYNVGHSPTGVALADFNNDGKLDIIVTNTGDNTASVLLGNGDGTFGLPLTVSTGTSPTAVVVYDVNQDGNLDALVANSGTDTVSILYGKGDGTFSSQSTLTVGPGPQGIAVADFNEDGIPDLAVTSMQGTAIDVFFGQGGSQFSTPQPIQMPGGTYAIAAGNFGNGHQDLVVTLPTLNAINSYLGQGDGTFVQGDGIGPAAGQSDPTSLAVGDFNQDGILDVAVGFAGATSNGGEVSYGTSGGFLQNATKLYLGSSVLGLAAGDFLNNGLPNLVASDTTIPGQYSGLQAEQAVSLLEDAQTYELTLTPVNIQDAQAHDVYAKYVPGPNDSYLPSYSNPALVDGALEQAVFFSPNLPASTTAGVLPGGEVVVQVQADGETQTSYNGPVQLTITGLTLTYSQTYTMNASAGVANFSSAIQPPTAAGLYRYTISIPNTSATNLADVTVTPSASTQIVLSNPYIAPAVKGISGAVGVTIEDQYGNPTPAFTGTVTLTTSDSAAVITPASVTLTSEDNGYAPFAVTFNTTGTQSITATTSGLTTNTLKQSNILVLAPATATTTALASSATGSVAAETPVKLTATVTAGGNPVTQGIVQFNDASLTQSLVASAELGSSGTAAVNLILPVGAHSLTATLVSSNAFAGSSSSAIPLTVDPAENYLTETALSATGSSSGYTLSAAFTAFGKAAPTGTALNFEDASNGNASLGMGTLGAATFGLQPQVTYAVGNGPKSVSVADFNGDGIGDLVVSNASDGTVSVSLGNGDGAFGSPQVIFTYPSGSTQQVLAGDFNGDGKQDFAILNADGSVFIALGNGNGTFATPVEVLSPPDGETANFNTVPYAMVAGDFNRDGHLDLAITDALDSTVLVLLGYGNGTFQTPVIYAGETTPEGITTADVNGDGKPDLIVTNSAGNTVSVLLGNGDGTFQKQTPYATGSLPLAVVAADLNGDGSPDLAVINNSGDTVSVLINNGNGTFATQVPYNVGKYPVNLVAADFNADGKIDLAVVNEIDSTISILDGNGNGTFNSQSTMATGSYPVGIAYGDFMGGGLNSLAVTNSTNANVSILLGDQTLPATLNNVALAGASVHNVDAIYTPGAADPYKTSTSNVVALEGSGLGPAATSTTIAASVNPNYQGVSVTFTATMTSQIGVLATGNVSFYDGTTLLGTAAIGANRTAAYSTTTLAVGSHNITAAYSGDQNFAASASPALVEVIETTSTDFTTLSVISSENPAPAGASITFTAVLAPTTSLPSPPTGNITFLDGTTTLGTVPVAANDTATLTISTLAAGKHSITAVYPGDSNYGGSTSAVFTETITSGSAASTTGLQASSTNVTAGTNVKLTATVTSTASGTPTGSVAFSDNGTQIGTATLSSGSAVFNTSTLAVGAQPITATYSGDSNFAPSTSPTVTVTVASDSGPATVAAPAISPAAGTYNAPVAVAITDSTSGSTIYYTTNGNVPTTSSTVYTAPFYVSPGTIQVQALATASGDTNSSVSSATYMVQPYLKFNAAQVGVAKASAQQLTATVSLVGSTTPTAALHYGLDYSAGAVSCTANGGIEVCTVPITFIPTLPGGRKDALFLMNGTTRVATVLLYGIGQSPMAEIQPGIVTDPVSNASYYIYNSAVDENGTVYYLATEQNAIYSLTKAGVNTQLPITGLNSPRSIAIDGAGVLYISDQTYYNTGTTPTPGTLTTYDTVQGTQGAVTLPATAYYQFSSVDGLGDLFVESSGNNSIYEFLSNGTTTDTVINPAITQPSNSAVDSAGNLFIGGYSINELTTGGTQTEINSAGGSGDGMGVDAADTVYATRYTGYGGVAQLAASNYSTPLATLDTAASPSGFGLGSDGTLWVGNYGDLDKVNRTQGAIAFGEQNVNVESAAQTVGVYNGGNVDLTLSALNITGTGFAMTPAATNGCTAGLAITPGQLCQVEVTATFPNAGTFSGTITFTTNSLNTTSTTQTVNLTGFVYGPYVTTTQSAAFGNQNIGSNTTMTVTLTNNGDLYNAGLGLGTATVPSGFTISGGTGTGSCGAAGDSLAPGASCAVTVTFSPTAATTYGGTVSIPVSSSGGGGPWPAATFAVSGTGVVVQPYGPPTSGSSAAILFVPAILSPVAGATETPTNKLNGAGSTGNGGPATAAQLNYPVGMAYDSNGNLFFADESNYVVRRIDHSTGDISIFAGTNGTSGDSTGGGVATSAQLGNPAGLTIDSNNNVYVSDRANGLVWKITSGGAISVFVGGGSSPTTCTGSTDVVGDGCLATQATLNNPWALAVDSSNNIYIADSYNELIRKVSASTNIITAFAGVPSDAGTQGSCNANLYTTSTGPYLPSQAHLCFPDGIAFDSLGDTFISEAQHDFVREINSSTGDIAIFAGTGTRASTGNGGPAIDATLNEPAGVYVDAANRVYISDFFGGEIRMVDSTGNITDVMGSSTGELIAASFGEPDTESLFISNEYTGAANGIYSFAMDLYGNIVATDSSGSAITSAGATGGGAYYFGNQQIYQTVTTTSLNAGSSLYPPYVLISNPSGVDLTFTGTPAVTGPFAISGGTCAFPGTLTPGQSCTVIISFTPTADQSYSGTITLDSNSNSSPNVIHLSGAGTGTVVTSASITPVVDFPNTPDTETSAQMTATLTNTSNPSGVPITITGATIAGNDPSDFAIVSTTCPVSPATLAGGATCNYYVTFSPPQAATTTSYNAQLQVAVAGYGNVNSTLSGTGTSNLTAQAITFTQPTTPVTYSSGLQISLVATGGASGNPVVFTIDPSSTGAGSINGSTLTVTSVGSFTVDANQAGNATYSAAPQVQRTVVVTQASQTITFTQPTSPVTYSGTSIVVQLSATGGASGNPVVFTIDPSSTATGSITGSTLTITSTGNLVIDANQAGNTNYSAAAQVQRTILVSALIAQAINFTQPTTPVTYSSGLQISLVATGGASGNPVVFTIDPSSTGAGSISGSTLTVTSVGSFTIDANQAGNATYSAAPQVQRTVVVTQASQTITFAQPTTPVTYSGASIVVQLSATGGASGNPVVFTIDESSTATGSITGSTLTITSIGNLVIDANQAGNTNYSAAAQVQRTIMVNALIAQAINFTQPTTPVTYSSGLQIPLVATGGASGNPVVFTIDPSSTGAGSISGSSLTVTSVGSFTIDANQAGNATYSAAPQVQRTVVVTQAPQTINFTQPTSPVTYSSGLQITLSATGGASGNPVVFTIDASSTATGSISGSTLTVTSTGNLVIDANQAGNADYSAAPQVQKTVTVNAQPPDFTVTATPPSQSIEPGGSAMYPITVTDVGSSFTSAVTLSVTGLPAGATASFNPTTITPDSESGTSTLTVTTANSAALARPNLWPVGAPALALLFMLPFRRWRRAWKGKVLLLVAALASLAGAASLMGCGGGFGLNVSESYTLTITGTSGTDTHSTTVQLTVK